MLGINGLIATHAGIALIAGFGGWKLRDADYQRHLRKDAEAKAQAQQETREVEAQLEGKAQEAREHVTRENTRTEIVYRTVTKEVPVYVTQTQFSQDVDAHGGLPAGFVWSYNQSASNSTAPLPSGIDPDAPTDVGMSALTLTTAENFAMCYQWRAEAEGWRAWYRDLEAIWPKPEEVDDPDLQK